MEVFIAMAPNLEVYHGGDGAKASGGRKVSKGYKNQQPKKDTMVQVEGSSFRGIVQAFQVVKKQ